MLKESQFAKDVNYAKRLLASANKSVEKITEHIENNNRDESIKEAFKYERIAEKLVNNARLLPVASGIPNGCEYVNSNIIEENNVVVEYTAEGWFHVRIPSLLPKKEGGDPSFIRTTLNAGLKKYFLSHKKHPLQCDSVMIFKHNYASTRTDREYRDHDNIEINSIVDMVALYSLVDDGPMKCKHFYCSCVEKVDSTEVFVVPKEDFITWINKSGLLK